MATQASRDTLYLRHILDAAARIRTYTAVGRDRFMAESHWHDATVRQLEIIGEATKRLSTVLRNQHPHIPWRRIAGLRDVLIHDYMGVDLDAVWAITQRELPDLELEVRSILGEGDDRRQTPTAS
jgi:uncharacterized protein with HEPN domain